MITLIIEVNPQITITQAHEIADAVEKSIINSVDNVYDILVHVEPAGKCQTGEKFGSIRYGLIHLLHRVFFTFLYHLSPTLPKALIHGDFRGGDRLFATYHRIYHLSPPDQSMINKEKRTGSIRHISFSRLKLLVSRLEQSVSRCETNRFTV